MTQPETGGAGGIEQGTVAELRGRWGRRALALATSVALLAAASCGNDEGGNGEGAGPTSSTDAVGQLDAASATPSTTLSVEDRVSISVREALEAEGNAGNETTTTLPASTATASSVRVITPTTEAPHVVGTDTHIHENDMSGVPIPDRTPGDTASPYRYWMSYEMPTDKDFGCEVDLRDHEFANRASSAIIDGGHAVFEHEWTPGNESQFTPTMSGEITTLESFVMNFDYADRFEDYGGYSFADGSDTPAIIHAEAGTTIQLFEDSGFNGATVIVDC